MNNGVHPEVPAESSRVMPWGGWFMTHVRIVDLSKAFISSLAVGSSLAAGQAANTQLNPCKRVTAADSPG